MREASLDLALPAEPACVPVVRREVARQLRVWGMVELVDPVTLAVSELTTNAVLHARGSLRVTLERNDVGVRLEVTDDSSRLPQQRRHSQLSGTGRGLQLVTALAEQWGVEALEGRGKVVWAVFLVTAGSAAGVDSRDGRAGR